MTSDELGADGIDIDDMVAINKIVNNVLYVSVTPSKRDMNTEEMARNIAVPLVFKLTPRVRTNFEIRLSLFILTFMQCNVVGSVTALLRETFEDKNLQKEAASMTILR